MWDILHLVLLPRYLLTYSVTQTADAVLTSRDKMTSTSCRQSIQSTVKPGFHSNARKVLRKKKYASKIKSAQETQETQENYASKKQKYASASHPTDASDHRFFTQRTQAPANRNARSKQLLMVASASACVFRLRNARIARNASACVACV